MLVKKVVDPAGSGGIGLSGPYLCNHQLAFRLVSKPSKWDRPETLPLCPKGHCSNDLHMDSKRPVAETREFVRLEVCARGVGISATATLLPRPKMEGLGFHLL